MAKNGAAWIDAVDTEAAVNRMRSFELTLVFMVIRLGGDYGLGVFRKKFDIRSEHPIEKV
jgi:hypothetical protein